jgi:hypothetical protein
MHFWNELFINQPVWVANLSNLTSITVLGAVIGLDRRFDCNQHLCLRIGHHKVEGTTYRTLLQTSYRRVPRRSKKAAR